MTTSIPVVVQNSDFTLRITLVDAAGAAVAVSSVSNIEVALYQRKEKLLQSWSLADNQLMVVDDAGGVIDLPVDRTTITSNDLRRLYCEVAVVVANSSFASGLQRIVVSDIPVADIVNSAMRN